MKRYAAIHVTLHSLYELDSDIDPLIAADVYIEDSHKVIVSPRGMNATQFVEWLANLPVDYIFTCQAAAVFAFIDEWAAKSGAQIYKPDSARGGRILENTIDRRDSEAAQYLRRVWVNRRTATRHVRCARFTVHNIEPLLGSSNINSIVSTMGVVADCDGQPACVGLHRAIQQFACMYKQVTGQQFFTPRGVATWTMGGAAKQYYLTLRYPDTDFKFKRYQHSHPQNELFEYKMRTEKLLIPGTLYVGGSGTGVREFGQCCKYDVNSLFPAVYRDLPELGIPRPCSWDEMQADVQNRFEYIIIFKYLKIKVKPGKPAVFSSPFEEYKGENFDTVEIGAPIAMFKGFVEALNLFYFIEDADVGAVYRLTKSKDEAMQKYVDTLYAEKVLAARAGCPIKAIYKFFLNNLHGKFAQKSIAAQYEYIRNDDTGVLERRDTGELIDEWKEKHFNYIQGAYIYSMARAEFFKKLNSFSGRLYYSDTDSIITPDSMPPYICSDYGLGDFKCEKIYNHMWVIAPKTYIGRTAPAYDNECRCLDIVCAGQDREYVRQHFSSYVQQWLEAGRGTAEIDTLIATILPHFKFRAPVLTRVNGGAVYVFEERHLKAVNEI